MFNELPIIKYFSCFSTLRSRSSPVCKARILLIYSRIPEIRFLFEVVDEIFHAVRFRKFLADVVDDGGVFLRTYGKRGRKVFKAVFFAYSAVSSTLFLCRRRSAGRLPSCRKARDRRKVIFVAITDFNDIKPEFRLIDVNF